MEYDQRDRRDPDADDASSPTAEPGSVPPTEGAVPTGSTGEPATSQEPMAPPEPAWAPDAPASPDAESWAGASSSASEPLAPQEPVADPRGAEPAWPTEPPEAGSDEGTTWPTSAPEQMEPAAETADWTPPAEPVAETAAQPETAWDTPTERTEPPPPEVEAYSGPRAAHDDGDAGGTGTAAAAGMAGAAGAAHSVPDTEAAVGESTQCPRCGTENRPGLAFCRNCGQRLVAAGVASTVERPGAPEGTMACPRCGTHNRAGVAFCQNCGANLRGTSPGYVPPAVAGQAAAAPAAERVGGAVLGPVVLLIGLAGIVTGYLLPFLYGTGSLYERAFGAGGYGAAFWSGYPEVGAELADQAYFGLAGPIPLLGLLLLALAVAGFLKARPGPLQTVGLVVALLWSVGLIILFLLVELAGNWSGDIVGMLRDLTPAGIIFFLAALIVLIGTLTRFARS